MKFTLLHYDMNSWTSWHCDSCKKRSVNCISYFLIDIYLSNAAAITDSVIAAQAFIFFLAGFETSSTTLSFCLYELALNPLCQEEAVQKIESARTKYGSLTYEAINELNYLELLLLGEYGISKWFVKSVKNLKRFFTWNTTVLAWNMLYPSLPVQKQHFMRPKFHFTETMRMYPPVANLCRVCTKPYRLPNSDVTIDPGVALVIPVYSLHHDPNYFPEPEKFLPDRFLDKEILKSHTYMPFGEGPRICIGE